MVPEAEARAPPYKRELSGIASGRTKNGRIKESRDKTEKVCANSFAKRELIDVKSHSQVLIHFFNFILSSSSSFSLYLVKRLTLTKENDTIIFPLIFLW